MKNVLIKSPIVSVNWLAQNQNAPNMVIVDASIPKVISENIEFDGLSKNQIKNARFIDLKNAFSDSSSEFPNTMLTPDHFAMTARDLGISNHNAIVVYDEFGIYSSPRAWWMFKAMGHDNIAVLDGGLPEWEKSGYLTEKKVLFSGNKGDFNANYNNFFFNNYQEVFEVITNKSAVIIDARSEERFKGLIEEPREGLRSGHIPTSVNMPYSKLVENNKMINPKKISQIFSKIVNEEKRLIFSCGSGITACILALGAEIIDLKNKSVYDGSWTEWGSKLELPIEK